MMSEVLGQLFVVGVIFAVIVYFEPDFIGHMRRPRQELPWLLRLLWKDRARWEHEQALNWPIGLIILSGGLTQILPALSLSAGYSLWVRPIALGCVITELLLLRYMWAHSDPR